MGIGGTLLRGVPVVGGELAGPQTADGYDTHHEERVKYARKLAAQAGKYDPAEYEQYVRSGSAPVNDAFSRAAQGAAQAYSARGLSASPVAAGTTAGFAGQRDQQMQAVQSRAADAARRALRQRTLDQYGAETGSWKQDNRSAMDAAAARQAEDQAMWNAILAMGSESISSSRDLQRELDREERRNRVVRDNQPSYFPEWSYSNPYGTSSI